MDPKTLMSYDGHERTRLYDQPPGNGSSRANTVNLSGKLLRWPDEQRKLLQLRVWTADARFWSQIALDVETHGVIASTAANSESDAWDYLARTLRLKGYKL